MVLFSESMGSWWWMGENVEEGTDFTCCEGEFVWVSSGNCFFSDWSLWSNWSYSKSLIEGSFST